MSATWRSTESGPDGRVGHQLAPSDGSKRVLMVAFHYPPCAGGSGVQRTLKFSHYLPENGWRPIVLSASPRAHSTVGDDQLDEIPSDVPVTRAFALDAGRHLSIGGWYSRWLAQPDRWVSWWAGAVPAGLRLIHTYRPDVIFTTYPIATAHLIGLTLHRATGLPWVADFRDSMTEDNYPPDVVTRRSRRWIEERTARHCSRAIFTAESTKEMYLHRYPELLAGRCVVIPNGYDDADFEHVTLGETRRAGDGQPARLIHAGLMYPEERDPRAFFRALARLVREGRLTPGTARFHFRAPGSEAYYSKMTSDLGLDGVVQLLPPLPHRRALQDCADADALLLFQGRSCNHQIPAKAYEYLRLKRPILALTPEQGDTAALLKETGGATILDLDDEEAMYQGLPRFLSAVTTGTHALPRPEAVRRYARSSQAQDLARCLTMLHDTRMEAVRRCCR